MKKKRILIFPCGSEVGLELNRSLKYSRHFKIYGGSSVDDHGKYVYENYIGNIPFVTDELFISHLKELIDLFSINAIYPAMDKVLTVLKENEKILDCIVIGSSEETNTICQSKKRTYEILKNIVPLPEQFALSNLDILYPIFMKPNEGYGSRGAKKISNKDAMFKQKVEYPDSLILEYLPGDEYTVDCFTDRNGKLCFVGPRERRRVRIGISVNTRTIEDDKKEEFNKIAQKINNKINFRGAWFFQVKRDKNDNLKLLEVASRIGGSTGVYRAKGINLALLSVWDAFDTDVSIIENDLIAEMDRAFDCKIKLDYAFNTVYVDFDDCLLIDNKFVNYELAKLLYKWFNKGKKIILISKHDGNLKEQLKKFRLSDLFDEIIQINKNELKSNYIITKGSIFIDDSFEERLDVSRRVGIPVYSPESII